jgi:hypothetical protein
MDEARSEMRKVLMRGIVVPFTCGALTVLGLAALLGLLLRSLGLTA